MREPRWRITLLAVPLLWSCVACARAPAADPDRAALEAAIQRWTAAVNAHDVRTLNATMTADVELLNGTATAAGRDAAVRALVALTTAGALLATTREITIADDVAWRVAGLAQARTNGDVQARGQALEIWTRVNGEWRLHRRMAPAGVTPGDLLTRPATKEPVLDQPRTGDPRN